MFKTLKRVKDGVLTSAYEKVYIVNFEKCPYILYIDQNVLKSLRKWYVSTGGEWICHSDLEWDDFKTLFNNLLEGSLKGNVRYEMDYMPFQQS
ncbi:DUF3884 family protein [Streptococcus uberis]|uniref:DUF3884 family protein n=1 Tax=Streptococcus uberis TaxID=1349 RepID=UPI0012B5F297|nr:DUF3884 family protein [Streptococcus uberis]MTB69853.1 DUF3884 family protein [Streptococcus uberis]